MCDTCDKEKMAATTQDTVYKGKVLLDLPTKTLQILQMLEKKEKTLYEKLDKVQKAKAMIKGSLYIEDTLRAIDEAVSA